MARRANVRPALSLVRQRRGAVNLVAATADGQSQLLSDTLIDHLTSVWHPNPCAEHGGHPCAEAGEPAIAPEWPGTVSNRGTSKRP